MIQAPLPKYVRMGLAPTPVDPNNLQAVVGYDLWFPASTGLLQFLVYPSASSTATDQGGVANNGDGTASDSGLLVQGIVKDNNGNPWFQVEDTTGQISGSAGITYFVPAVPEAVPASDASSTNAITAGAVNSAAPASSTSTTASNSTGTTNTTGTVPTSNTNTQSTGTGTTGSGSGSGNGILPGSNGINAPWPTGLKIGLGILGLIVAVVTVNELSKD